MSMTNPQPAASGGLISRYYERLYRLALLATGQTQRAAALVEATYRRLPPGLSGEQAEQALLAGLYDARLLRRARWTFQPAELERTTLGPAQAGALLRLLAGLPAAQRLAIGLAFINGSSPIAIDALLGAALPAGGAAALLASLRISAAQALELVPAAAPAAELVRLDRWAEGQASADEQLAVRRDLLAQPELRAIRDGLLAMRELLPRALPALFAAEPPPGLATRLLAGQARPPRTTPAPGARRARLGLVAGVLLLVAVITLAPAWLARSSGAANGPAASIRSGKELIDAALHRFDQPPLQQGVLHERYRVERNGQPALLIERWYDYAPPHQLAIRVVEEGAQPNRPPLIEIASDGQSLVQLRYDSPSAFGQFRLDIDVSSDEAHAIVPLLRGQPLWAPFGRDERSPGDLGPYFLAQARAAGATLLGQTSRIGREAFLLSYETNRPPTLPAQAAPGQPVRVLLAIDAQTYALLEVAFVATDAAEATAQHPVRAELLELLDSATDAPFRLASQPGIERRSGATSIRFPFIGNAAHLTIDAAAQRMPDKLLALTHLPDVNMRGVAISNGDSSDAQSVALLYEGEFQNVVLLPRFTVGAPEQPGEEQIAGAYRYRIVGDRVFAGALTAVVYRPDAPEQTTGVILSDDLATDAERRATLARMIESLVPVDARSLPALRQIFVAPAAAGGR